MADQGVRDDEWRLQRIRPFDWYSVDYKRQAQRELQAKYWRAMEHRSPLLPACRPAREGRRSCSRQWISAPRPCYGSSDPAYWDALALLARLYEEGNQKELATQKLKSMQDFLAAHPDPRRSAQLEDLRKLTEKP